MLNKSVLNNIVLNPFTPLSIKDLGGFPILLRFITLESYKNMKSFNINWLYHLINHFICMPYGRWLNKAWSQAPTGSNSGPPNINITFIQIFRTECWSKDSVVEINRDSYHQCPLDDHSISIPAAPAKNRRGLHQMDVQRKLATTVYWLGFVILGAFRRSTCWMSVSSEHQRVF
jgi:hypothetical protein